MSSNSSISSPPSGPTRSRASLISWGSLALASALAAGACSTDDPPDGDTGSGGASPHGSGGAGSGGDAAVGGQSSGGSSGGESSGGAPTGGAAVGGMGGDATGGAATGGDTGSGGAGTVELPDLLSETGLYSDITTGVLASGVRAFAPQFALWSDEAEKSRWIYLPEGEQIDTTDIDNWVYPVGTKLWKDFTRDGVRVETRLIMRTRTGGRGWKGVAYIWNEAQTEATATPLGQDNALGTEHDVPDEGACQQCHGDRPDWPLGFSAVQLSHSNDGLTIDDLVAEGLLSENPAAPIVVPGTVEERAALGYMHANCGSCHRSDAAGTERTGLMMWLKVAQLDAVDSTDTYNLLVNQPTVLAETPDILEYRVYGGDSAQSEIYRRTGLRDGSDSQMPPIGSEMVDDAGRAIIETWINSLSPPTGG